MAIYLLPKPIPALIFAAGLAGMLLFEWLRRQRHPLAKWVAERAAPVLRAQEAGTGSRMTGATYVLVAALLCTLLFSVPVAVTALAIMLVADAAASLIGKRYGKTPILGKTVEGSAAFFITAVVTIVIIGQVAHYPLSFYVAALVAAAVATGVELVSGRAHIDDNLSIPLAAAGSMWFTLLLI